MFGSCSSLTRTGTVPASGAFEHLPGSRFSENQHGKAAPPSPQLPFSSCDLKTQTLLRKELSSVSSRHTSLVLSSLAQAKQHFLLFFWKECNEQL